MNSLCFSHLDLSHNKHESRDHLWTNQNIVSRNDSSPTSSQSIEIPPFTLNPSSILPSSTYHHQRRESSHLWKAMYELRIRSLNRSKLKQTSSISSLLAGFALVALVEMDLYPLVPMGLLLFFAITSTLLVGVHMVALMIATCILPHIDAVIAVEEGSCSSMSNNQCRCHQKHAHHCHNIQPLESELCSFGLNSNLNQTALTGFIDFAWSSSTILGIFLFILELVAIIWVKFYDTQVIALFATALLCPILLALGYFVIRFYKLMIMIRFESAHKELDHLHQLMVVELSYPTPATSTTSKVQLI